MSDAPLTPAPYWQRPEARARRNARERAARVKPDPGAAIAPWRWRRPRLAPPPRADAGEGPPGLDWWAALEALEGAYAASTLHELKSDVRLFHGWCQKRGCGFLPAAPADVAGFVDWGFARWARRSVQRRLAAIRKLHLLLGLADPTRALGVRVAWRRGCRQNAVRSRQAIGVTQSLRDRLLAACPDDLIGLRDRALIRVGYDTLCRRAELINLRLEDVTWLPDGTAKVRIRQSKTDPYGVGQTAYISADGRRTLEAWLTRAGLAGGPIFRPVLQSHVGRRALDPRAVNQALALAARRAGLPPALARGLTGHSLRVGAAQDLAAAGKSLLQIMRAGRWSNISVVAGYVRQAEVNVWADGG
jgi:site-specific recombinase XerD